MYAVLTALVIMLLGALLLNFDAVRGFLGTLNSILIPIYIGFGIAYIANPIMKISEKYIFRYQIKTDRGFRVKRVLSITFAMLVLAVAVTVLILLIIPQVFLSLSDLTSKLTLYYNSTIAWLDGFLPDSIFSPEDFTLNSFITKLNDYLGETGISDMLSAIAGGLDANAGTIEAIVSNAFTLFWNYAPTFFGYFKGIADGVINAVLGVFFAIYMLSSKEKLVAQLKKAIRAFTNDKIYHSAIELGHFSNKTFGAYLIGKVLDSVAVGIVMFIICKIAGIPYAILVSTLVAITNIIPVIGPFIGAIPGVLIIFIVEPTKVIPFIIINIVVQQIDGNIIVPKLLGETTGLDSIWVLFSITVMGSLWGLFGMFICVPIFAILYMLLKLFIEKRLHAKDLPMTTSEYYSDGELQRFTEHEENTNSFAARVKKSGEQILSNSLGEKLKKLLKKKTKKPRPAQTDDVSSSVDSEKDGSQK